MAKEGVHLFLGYDGLSMILNALLLFLDDQGVFCVLPCMLSLSPESSVMYTSVIIPLHPPSYGTKQLLQQLLLLCIYYLINKLLTEIDLERGVDGNNKMIHVDVC